MSERERDDLAVAIKTMQAVKYPDIDTVIEKIGAVFKNTDNSDWVKIDFPGWSSTASAQNKFADIKNAILRNNIIKFDYINANGEKSSRFVEPEQLYFNANTWYLIGFCLNKNEHRMFRISRIKNVLVTDKSFVKRAFSPNENVGTNNYSNPLTELLLRFSPKMLFRLYDFFDEEFITPNKDGGFDVRVIFPEGEWVYGFILSFGHFVEVIEPIHIRNIVIERLKSALKMYGEN